MTLCLAKVIWIVVIFRWMNEKGAGIIGTDREDGQTDRKRREKEAGFENEQ